VDTYDQRSSRIPHPGFSASSVRRRQRTLTMPSQRPTGAITRRLLDGCRRLPRRAIARAQFDLRVHAGLWMGCAAKSCGGDRLVSQGRGAGASGRAAFSWARLCEWRRRAARRCGGRAMACARRRAGFAQAQFMLGLMTLDGRGVAKDPVQGYALMVIGGQGGVRSAARVRPEAGADRSAARPGPGRSSTTGRPKPESSLAGRRKHPRCRKKLLGLDRHIGEVVDPSTWPRLGDRCHRRCAFQHGRLVLGHARCTPDRADRRALPVERAPS